MLFTRVMRWDSRVVGSFWNLATERSPLQRSFHTAVVQNNIMYVLGGETYDDDNRVHLLGSFLSYSLTSGESFTIGTSVYGAHDAHHHLRTQIPPLSHHSMNLVDFVNSNQAQLIVFGGQLDAQKQISSNYMFSFNLKDRKWTQVTQKGAVPEPRYDHTMCVVGSKLYLYGGTNTDEYFKHLYIFDLQSNTWVKAKTHGKSPGRRSGHSAVIYGTSIYVFGGGNDEKLFNDIYMLDTETLTWKEVKTDSSAFVPTQRIHHTASVVGNRMIAFGGTGKGNPDASVLSFDFDDHEWRCEPLERSTQNPPPLIGHSSVSYESRIWVFGGYYAMNNAKINKGHLFSLETEVKGVSPIHVPKSKLAHNLSTLVNDCDVSDFIFELNDGQHFYAHKAILKVRSPYLFKACIRLNTDDMIDVQGLVSYLEGKRGKEKLSLPFTMEAPQMTEDLFELIMDHIYSDTIPEFDNLNEYELKTICYLARLFQLNRLYKYAIPFVDSKQNPFIPPPNLQRDMYDLFNLAKEEYGRIINQSQSENVSTSSSKMEDTDSSVDSDTLEVSEDENMNSSSLKSDHWADPVLRSTYSTASSASSRMQSTVGVLSSIPSVMHLVGSVCDVLIRLDESTVPAHRCILIARSEYFRQLLITKDPHEPYKKEIALNGLRCKTLQMILEFLYTGTVDIPFDVALELLVASENFNLSRLSMMCQQVLEKKIRVHNACHFLMISERYGLGHLRKSCSYFIVHHLSQVRKCKSYQGIPREMKHELKLLRKQLKSDGEYEYQHEDLLSPKSGKHKKKHKHKKSNFKKSYHRNGKKPKKHRNKKRNKKIPLSAVEGGENECL